MRARARARHAHPAHAMQPSRAALFHALSHALLSDAPSRTLTHPPPRITHALQKEDFALGVINDVIFLKLVTIFSSILDASEIANNYIVIDRTAAKSPAADVLIEAALASTTARPVRATGFQPAPLDFLTLAQPYMRASMKAEQTLSLARSLNPVPRR